MVKNFIRISSQWLLVIGCFSLNLYTFAAGNPISVIDPGGTGPQEIGASWLRGPSYSAEDFQPDAAIWSYQRVQAQLASAYYISGPGITAGQLASATLNLVPGVGGLKMFGETVAGQDAITGERIDNNQTATNSKADASYFKNNTGAASRYSPALPQWGGVFTYHSERFNTRATHIQCCPGQPRACFRCHRKFPANRVRSATASGSVANFMTPP